MFEAFRARARLSPSDRSVFDTKLIEGTFSAADLLSQLDTQLELARLRRRSAESLNQTIVLCWVFAALTLVLGFLLGPVWLLLPASMVFCALVLALVRWRLRRFMLPAQPSATAFPFLTALKHDLADSAMLRVRLDLSSPIAKTKREHVSEPYTKNFYRAVDTTYRDAWFEGEARLADGCQLCWSVTDLLRVHVRTKQRRSGRTKSKTRYFKASHIEISVSFPTKLYRVQEVPAVARQKVSMRQGEKRCTLTVKRVVKRRSADPLEPRQLLDTVAVAFRAARPVRGAA
jgi:hypothetical protein